MAARCRSSISACFFSKSASRCSAVLRTRVFFSEIRPHIIKDSVYQITAKDCFALRDALSNRYNNLANFPAIAEDYYILDVLSKEIDVALSKYNNGDIWTPQHAALGHLNEWLKASLPILEAVLDK